MKYNTSSSDIYCYKDTDILINKLEIKNTKQLKKIEKQIVTNKNHQLILEPILGEFDFQHLKEIHKFLFEELYEFAGKTRTADISKGQTQFCRSIYIEDNASEIFEKLTKEPFEKYNKNKFVHKLAEYMSDINMLHPFREGNGRATREFFRLFALKYNWDLNLNSSSPEMFLNAMIRSISNSDELENILKGCIKRLFLYK